MLEKYVLTKYVKIEVSQRRSCSAFSLLFVPFPTGVLVFLNINHHLTTCSMDMYSKKNKRGAKVSKMANLDNFSLDGIISV
jgi:hypothetical protein